MTIEIRKFRKLIITKRRKNRGKKLLSGKLTLIFSLLIFSFLLGALFVEFIDEQEYVENNLKQTQSLNPSPQSISNTEDILAEGNLLYTANGQNGFAIYDINDPSNPSLLGQNTTSGQNIHSLTLRGDLLFLADYDNGLVIHNVSDPSNPLYYANLTVNGHARDISISDDFAYVVSGMGGLTIVNISNPQDLDFFVNYDNSETWVNSYFAIEVIGDLAYIADNSKLYVLNVSNPIGVELLGEYGTSLNKFSRDLEIRGDKAFICYDSAGFAIVNITDPTNLNLLSQIGDGNGDGHQIKVEGNIAYMADGTNGIKIFDIEDTKHPELIAIKNSTYDTQIQDIHSLFVNGRYLFTADYTSTELLSFKIANGQSAAVLDKYQIPGEDYYFTDVEIDGDLAFVAHQNNFSLRILNISNPSVIEEIGIIENIGFVDRVEIEGNIAYIQNTLNEKISAIDVSDPQNPTKISEYQFDGTPVGEPNPDKLFDFFVDGGIVYICAGAEGLIILNYKNPNNPTLVGNCSTSDARDVAIVGDIAYIADNVDGLVAIDISLLYNPTHIFTYNPDNDQYNRILISNNISYLGSSEDNYIYTVNITNKINPNKLDSGYQPFGVEDLIIEGNTLYILTTIGYIYRTEISDPANLWSGSLSYYFYPDEHQNRIHNFYLDGNILYSADYRDGLIALKVNRGGTDDFDGDGLTYLTETFQYGTNPSLDDTDGDEVGDDYEIQSGTDPNNPEDYPDIFNPTVNLNSPSNQGYATQEITINATISDADSAIDTVFAEIDGTDNITLTQSTGDFYTALVSLTEGNHIVKIFANDTAGNLNDSQQIAFFTDLTAPSVILTDPINQVYRTSNINITLSGDADTYYYYIDSIDSTNQTWTQTVTRTLEDGQYTIYVYGVDALGNLNDSISVGFSVNTTSDENGGLGDPNNPPNTDPQGGLGVGGIVGIVIAVIATIGISLFYLKKKRAQ